MNQQETEAHARKLAGMKCPCNECHPDQYGLVVDSCFCPGKDRDQKLCRCHGTGHLFPASVREPCHLTRTTCSLALPSCETYTSVWCLGWTPSLDFLTWCQAVAWAGYKLDIGFVPFSHSMEILVRRPNGMRDATCDVIEALLIALAKGPS